MNPDPGSAAWRTFCGDDSTVLQDDFVGNEQA
jgi:hypothetical protein